MDWLTHLLWNDLIWHDGKLLGIDWSVWKVVGWLGNAVFFSRFFVQWYATEKKKQVVVPQAFWWLSLVGSLTASVVTPFTSGIPFSFSPTPSPGFRTPGISSSIIGTRKRT